MFFYIPRHRYLNNDGIADGLLAVNMADFSMTVLESQ